MQMSISENVNFAEFAIKRYHLKSYKLKGTYVNIKKNLIIQPFYAHF